ncbi:MAG: nucleotidyltransferase domain-containing protein [Promethearchaeota archaeon]
MENKTILLTALVGSRAHGLAREDSDFDYRRVYIIPTEEILSLNFKYKGADWIEGNIDNTAYELGHFLQLAVKSNPTILEVFMAPIVQLNTDGQLLLDLFPYIWDVQNAYDAFVGYGHNQRKKMLENKDNKSDKFAIAYIRTLFNLIILLKTGRFSMEIKDPVLKEFLLKIKEGKVSYGEIIDRAEFYKSIATKELENCTHTNNPKKINNFLIKMRKKYMAIKS